jgi:hypothetical protein
VFFLPQLVQLLRGDDDGAIQSFFLTAAAHSDLFAHQLIWALNSEAKPPEEAFNPEVKRCVRLQCQTLCMCTPWGCSCYVEGMFGGAGLHIVVCAPADLGTEQ